MAIFDVFNGDADGICALIQFRRSDPQSSKLVTGVKRDIQLLNRVRAKSGDTVNVFDISLARNRKSLINLLEKNVGVFFVDHHFAGELPAYSNLRACINTEPEVCTSALINGYLHGKFVEWAAVGCFGDNLQGTANKLLDTSCGEPDREALKNLGELINYNRSNND